MFNHLILKQSVFRILFLLVLLSCSSLEKKNSETKVLRETINGYTQFEVFKDPVEGAKNLLGYDEINNTAKLCEGEIDKSVTKSTIDLIIDAKDTQSLSASLPAGLSLPVEARTQLETSEITKITLKLINPIEYRLLDYRLTDKAKTDPKYRDEKCIVGLLYAEKIQMNVQTADNTKVGGGVKVKEIELFISKANDTSTKSQKKAENVFVGFKSTLPGASRSSALLRSAVLPGWGQFYKGENIKGSLFTGGFLLATLVSASAYNNFNAKKNEYNDAKTADLLANLTYTGFSPIGIFTYSQANSISGQVNQAGNLAQGSLYGLGALYIFNLFDAFFLGSTTGGAAMNESPYRVHYNYYATNLGTMGTQQNYEFGIIGSF
ncbi:hypothetical protein EHQ58_09090 [Leptospira ognonensis]|uniref:DUF5683 domain-containing protein n=1 Tax=Leptospira ognonensis TaxID=2484945 RepID=A0A4R9K551_9LEPT|nr:DUF5683 domain-containing protein [Leptospira ognonensis]TGL59387.1 hypothetical protein EHQ58_09090 [Leptospira ognonensis]